MIKYLDMEENQVQPVVEGEKKGVGMWVVLGIVGLVVVVGGVLMLRNSRTQNVNPPTVTEVAIEPTVLPAEETTMEAGEVIKEFVVEGSPFKFLPTVLRVKKGDTVRVVFKNMQGTHDFVIDEFDVRTNQIGEGEEEEVEFTADKVGTFEYYCSVGNHRAMGMVGKLIVE
ncbi:MAG: blue (type 1) copper domain-containing protein [Microgenomates group bacterium Gr01-1014_16]|nr:MAG: blue (type 1) copper domain-containing protein [Microgenomates group bacterium Gr01-1014_16]